MSAADHLQPLGASEGSVRQGTCWVGMRKAYPNHLYLFRFSACSKYCASQFSTLRLTVELLRRFTTISYQYCENNSVQTPIIAHLLSASIFLSRMATLMLLLLCVPDLRLTNARHTTPWMPPINDRQPSLPCARRNVIHCTTTEVIRPIHIA